MSDGRCKGWVKIRSSERLAQYEKLQELLLVLRQVLWDSFGFGLKSIYNIAIRCLYCILRSLFDWLSIEGTVVVCASGAYV